MKIKENKMKIKEMLKEMEEYGWTEERIKDWYEDSGKIVSFEKYIEEFYNGNYYMSKDIDD